MTEMNGKSKVVAGFLALFLGGFGAHRFYLGQSQLGLLYIAGLFMFGVSIVVGFVDGFRYLLMSDANFTEKLRGGSTSSSQLAPVPQVEQEQPTHLTQIHTEKFDLALLARELKITRRLYATTIKQTIDTSITNAREGEFTVDLASISGVRLMPASDDKMRMGYFSGRLAFISSLDTVNQIIGSRHQGDLEFDFTKSSEAKVRAFVRAFEARREELRASVQENPIVSSSKSLSDELKEIAELRASGLLTEEEFAKAKQKFLEGN